jgi:hypothetical protein
MSSRHSFLSIVKSNTDRGPIFWIRCIAVYSVLVLSNLGGVIRLWFSPVRKLDPANPPANAVVGVLSLYRPLFWHGKIFESQMGHLLKAEGKQIVSVLCGGFMEACDIQSLGSNKQNNPTLCSDCRLRNQLFHKKDDTTVVYLDKYVDRTALAPVFAQINSLKTIEALRGFEYGGMPLGKITRLSVCRYHLRLRLDDSHVPVYQRYLRSAVMLHQAFSKLIDTFEFERFLIFNGRYVTFNVPLKLVERRAIPFASYEFSEQDRIFLVKNDVSVMWNDVNAKFGEWLKTAAAVPQLREEVEKFMDVRKQRVVANYLDLNQSFEMGDVDLVAFTNVVWDSAAFERDTLFTNQYVWITEIIEFARANPDLKVAVRIHPAEVNTLYNKTREKFSDFLTNSGLLIPSNVVVIRPEDRRNSYGLMRKAKVVTAYTSSIGLEAALEGKAVVIAGWSHYAREGITLNPKTSTEYFEVLGRLARGEDTFTPDVEFAQKYVYWYYKLYHRLNNTNLHNRPFHAPEDSRYFKVPQVTPTRSAEMAELAREFQE